MVARGPGAYELGVLAEHRRERCDVAGDHCVGGALELRVAGVVAREGLDMRGELWPAGEIVQACEKELGVGERAGNVAVRSYEPTRSGVLLDLFDFAIDLLWCESLALTTGARAGRVTVVKALSEGLDPLSRPRSNRLGVA